MAKWCPESSPFALWSELWLYLSNNGLLARVAATLLGGVDALPAHVGLQITKHRVQLVFGGWRLVWFSVWWVGYCLVLMSACVNLSRAQIPRLVLQTDGAAGARVPCVSGRAQPADKKKNQRSPVKKRPVSCRVSAIRKGWPRSVRKRVSFVRWVGAGGKSKSNVHERDERCVESVRPSVLGGAVCLLEAMACERRAAGLVGTGGPHLPLPPELRRWHLFPAAANLMCAPFCTPPAPDPNKRIPSKFNRRLFSAVAYFLFGANSIFLPSEFVYALLAAIDWRQRVAKGGKIRSVWSMDSFLFFISACTLGSLANRQLQRDGKVFTWYVSVNFERSFLSTNHESCENSEITQ